MALSGQLVSESGIDRDAWVALINQHPSLAHIASTQGTNPFTRETIETRPPETSALILFNGNEVGTIYWAMDDSPMLIVDADTDEAKPMIDNIASFLDARFIQD